MRRIELDLIKCYTVDTEALVLSVRRIQVSDAPQSIEYRVLWSEKITNKELMCDGDSNWNVYK
jgi:hypothetical protein